MLLYVGNKLPPLTLSRRPRVKLNAEEVCHVVHFALTWPGSDHIGDWLEGNIQQPTAR